MIARPLTLANLLARISPRLEGLSVPEGGGSVTVAGVSSDSRRIRPGELFVVVHGAVEDGAAYAADAVAAGASVLVASQKAAGALTVHGVPVVTVEDPRVALPAIAAAFHDHPARSMTMVGVTGTNGKTTVTYLVRAILDHAERGPTALFGTIAHEWGDRVIPALNTTPGPAELHAMLGAARDAGCAAVALEASSHALHQRRVEGIAFSAAVFTNLSGDHLDYHLSMDAYAASKATLFRGLAPGAVAVVNAEDPFSPTMLRGCEARVIRYGLDAPSDPDVTARDVSLSVDGVEFTLVTPEGTAAVKSALLGRYNLMNLLAAAAAATGLGVPVAAVAEGLSSVALVRGRLESVDAGQPFRVLVDYAHTDDAVSNVLRNLRGVVTGRVIAVLGCGGDRDRTKRPRMARAAAELADLCWITSDNPRTEDPQAIIDDMLGGVYGARNVWVEPDRRAAIGRALAAARVGDCVAILGKGHEDYQILGHEKTPFDDREVAAAALTRLMAASGTALRTR